MAAGIWREQWWQIGIAIAATSGALFSGNSTVAQIAPDRTLGAESSVVTPNVDIKGVPSDRIDGGAVRGANLFHSFQEFNVREGRGAYFSNPAGIENILSRVTGSNPSNILGTLGVLGNANLFFLNPNGIIFGPDAKLDMGGSFFGSTANSLNFEDGKLFSATNPNAPPLLTMKVPLGVQFGKGQPSAIVNSGNLSVGKGQNLTLTGGTVVSTGQLSAPEGQVAVAAVPSESLVKINPSAQLLNIDTPSLGSGKSSLSVSLAELLASVDEKARPGLTVNSNGQVELAGSGLPLVDGDVVAKNVTAQTATLTAIHNLTLVESLLATTGDMNLLAGDTVRVRDSAANPFVAQAGGNLLVQGRQGVDIFALNHPSSGLFSGGDMVLRSANTVGGDAHYWAGGNFRIEQMDGSLGGLFSPYDPIIRARGDVSFDSYTGGSLHIFAGGSVTIPGTVTITGADPDFGLPEEEVTLSDGTQIQIDGRNSPTLDIRAGTTDFGTPGIEGNVVNLSIGDQPTSATINVGNIRNINVDENQQPIKGNILLTNQYEPNGLTGDINIGSIDVNADVPIMDVNADVTIDSRGAINTSRGTIDVSGGLDSENVIRLIANANITTANLLSDLLPGNSGNGGDISLLSRNGTIDTTAGTINSQAGNGIAGNITLRAAGNIRTGNITASSNSSNDNQNNFNTIRLESSQGSVILNGVQLTTTNTGRDLAGTIDINGQDILIAESNISSTGDTGEIFIGTNVDDNVTTENVTINDSKVITTNNTNTGVAGDIEINGTNIQITDTNGNRDTAIESQGVAGRIFIGIINNANVDTVNTVTADNVTIRNSEVDPIRNVSSNILRDEPLNIAIQIASNREIKIEGSTVTASTVVPRTSSGNIILGTVLRTNSSVILSNDSSLTADGRAESSIGGEIVVLTDKLKIENGAEVSANSTGKAGNVLVLADQIRLNNGKISASTGENVNAENGAGVALLGNNGTSVEQFNNEIRNLNSLLANNQLRDDNIPGSQVDFLLLQNNSEINANAGNLANGGNIIINTKLLLADSNDNDITANALQGQGGNLAINTRPLGAYNIEPREQDTPLSDITAISINGLDGNVFLGLPDVDPSRGLIELPEDLGDSSSAGWQK